MKIKVKNEVSKSISRKDAGRLPFIPSLGSPDTFIRKFVRIVIDDIRYKLTGFRSGDREKWEAYRRFEELARGK